MLDEVKKYNPDFPGDIPKYMPLNVFAMYHLSADIIIPPEDSSVQSYFEELEKKLHDYTYRIHPSYGLPNSYSRGGYSGQTAYTHFGYAYNSSPRSPQTYDISRYDLEIYATNIPNMRKLTGFTATEQLVPMFVDVGVREWVQVDGYAFSNKQTELLVPETEIEYDQIRVIPS